MFCSSCGVALSKQLKYCNRCGAQVAGNKGAGEKSPEKRLDDYLDGLFWISVLGLAVILGGIIAMKKLNLADWLVVVFLILSSTVFLINIGLSLREILRMTRTTKSPTTTNQLDARPVGELSSTGVQATETVSSVTEHTTRELESIPRGRPVL